MFSRADRPRQPRLQRRQHDHHPDAPDAGRIVDPDGLRAQLEGGFLQAAGWTLCEEVSFDREGIRGTDWETYPVQRFDNIPEIDVVLLDAPKLKSLGAGEAACGPAVAAIANAVCNATGLRLRRLPSRLRTDTARHRHDPTPRPGIRTSRWTSGRSSIINRVGPIGGAISMSADICYSLVVPVYNEAEVLPLLFERLDTLIDQMDAAAEVVLVNDGSHDASPMLLQRKAQADERYRIVNLSRNFGHQIAITAGIDHARGQAVIVMDADLQDPPEVVHQMIAQWQAGFAVVSAKRERREGESFFKRWTAHVFYRVLRRMTSVEIEQDVGDFKLLDRKVVEAFSNMREQDRFVRGMISWLGFKQTSVSFVRAERAAGRTKYPLLKMMRLATNGIVGFSDMPLRVALWFGALVSALAIFFGLWVTVGWFFNSRPVQGWTSTVVILSFLGGVNLMMFGVVGLYVGRIYEQVKNRPLYVVDTADGGEQSDTEGRDASLGTSP